MKIDKSKEWWIKQAQEEGDHCVTAGRLINKMTQEQAQLINKKFDELTEEFGSDDIVTKKMEDFISEEFQITDHDSQMAMIIEAHMLRW